jgi:DUF4097 and DUF4098 domain-containing protein YvlB
MNTATRCVLTLAYAWSAVALGSVDGPSISKVNGSVRLESGEVAGDVTTVNGSVTLGSAARAEDIETVNGSVRIEDRAVLESAQTVNGGITLGEGSEVRGDVETVNGSITLRPGVQVQGSIGNVNGDMLLDGASVGAGIETVNGDIRIATGSRVAGGIHVEETQNRNHWYSSNYNKRNPRITVEQGAVVTGPLRFEREVDLYVAPGVTLPAVEGVEPKRFALQ